MITEDILRELLAQLKDGNEKAVSLGHSPVVAIEASWEAEARKLVSSRTDPNNPHIWWIRLTKAGKEFIEIPAPA